jgi:hypothetical protein
MMKQRAAFKVMYSQAPEEEERRDPDDDDDDDIGSSRGGRITLADGRRVPNGQKTPEVRITVKSIFRIFFVFVCFREFRLVIS